MNFKAVLCVSLRNQMALSFYVIYDQELQVPRQNKEGCKRSGIATRDQAAYVRVIGAILMPRVLAH